MPTGPSAPMIFKREGQRGQEGRDRQEGQEGSDGTVTLPARTCLVAAGTSPNITCENEAQGTFALDAKKKFFQPHKAVERDGGGFSLVPDRRRLLHVPRRRRQVRHLLRRQPSALRRKRRQGDGLGQARVSAGDQVVRARAGVARSGARSRSATRAWTQLTARLDAELIARVVEVVRLTPTIIEVIVKAPAAARHFEPGQFYRLQNFESMARRAGDVPLLMEGIALTGAWVDKDRGLLSLIALELGVSSRLVAHLQPGEPVVVMGPTGAPTEIPDGQNVLLLGGGLGNAVLFSIARAMREHGNRVIYFAGYKKGEDLFKREEIEAATDQVIWSTDIGAAIAPGRPQDAHFRGNIVQAMLAYQNGELGERLVPLDTVDRIIAIGSDRMMAAVKAARHGVLEPHLKPQHVGIASINSPMQCMMKEVCAQCLQKHVDPATGGETIIFSCFNQDQEMDRVDFPNLAARLRQNTVQEKLASLWFDIC